MPKHNHIDENRAREIGESLKKGKTDIIVPCKFCREKIEMALDSKNENKKKDSLVDIGILKLQMNMTGEFVKKFEGKEQAPEMVPTMVFVRQALQRLSQNERV